VHPKTKLYLLAALGVALVLGVILVAVAQFGRPGRRKALHALGVGMAGAALGSLVVVVFA
jgi:hypothetical protein